MIVNNSVILKKKHIFNSYSLRYIQKDLNKCNLLNYNDYSNQIVNTDQLVVFIIITNCDSRKRVRYSSIFLCFVNCFLLHYPLSSEYFNNAYTDIPVLENFSYLIYKETIF